MKASSLLLLILAVFILPACNNDVATNKVTDPTTGLTTEFQSLKPRHSFLIMNNEVLNHTDIPIGESFQIVNDSITGLTIKDGKVSIGCSLIIQEKNGAVLLDKKDIYEGKDVLDSKDLNQLRCTIFTGGPMKWEELYDIKVVFWDKFGTEKLTNTLTIRAIDIP